MTTNTKTNKKTKTKIEAYPAKLFSNGDANTKLRKNAKKKVITLGLSLAPHKSSWAGNVCPHASPGCIAACLDHQGLASVFASIQEARQRKTKIFYHNRSWFLDKLAQEIEVARRRADAQGKTLAVRLNVFSDIPWERVSQGLFRLFGDVEFYDYTKNPKRVGLLRPNYWVTLSRSELNDQDCLRALRRGNNVAVVFADMSGDFCGNMSGLQKLPKTWNGYPVIDGDISDLRYQDTRGRKHGRVVGLRLKTHSKAERRNAIKSGFPVRFNED